MIVLAKIKVTLYFEKSSYSQRVGEKIQIQERKAEVTPPQYNARNGSERTGITEMLC